MIIVTPSLSKNFFLSTRRRKAGVFKFLQSEERFRKTPGFRISMDGRPNRRNKAPVFNFSGVLRALLKPDSYDTHGVRTRDVIMTYFLLDTNSC